MYDYNEIILYRLVTLKFKTVQFCTNNYCKLILMRTVMSIITASESRATGTKMPTVMSLLECVCVGG